MPTPVQLDFSKAQPISQGGGGVTLDFSKAQPIAQSSPAPSMTANPQPGFFENLGHAFGIGQQEWQAAQQQMKDHPIQSMTEAALGPGYSAIKGLAGGFMRSTGELGSAVDSMRQHNAPAAALHAIKSIPIVGPALDKMADEAPATTPGQSYMSQVRSAATPGNVGTALGTAAQIAPMALGAADMAAPGRSTIPTPGSSIVKRMMDPLRDYRSPAISTQEAIGRRTTDILHPNPAAYRGVSSAITENAPYIKDFAQSTGNKLGTPLDFAKASTGAGQEASNFFKENLIDPNAELQTPHGTIGEVHQRLGEINDELRPAFRTRTGGQELTALERKNLEAERDQLNDTLYGTLSERSGIPVEKIQAINQRGGALQHVGDEADAAQAMRRAGFSGYTPTGLPMPFTALERGMRVLNYVRGGPERVAGKQLGRVFNLVDSPAEPLPDPQSINNYRQMVEQSDLGNMSRTIERQNQNQAASMARKPAGMGPTQPPQAETMSPDPQLRTMADSQASRRANVTQQREVQQAGNEAERQRQAENYATRGTRLERLRQKLKEQ